MNDIKKGDIVIVKCRGIVTDVWRDETVDLVIEGNGREICGISIKCLSKEESNEPTA